jgi:predicted nucleic acid-binding protein
MLAAPVILNNTPLVALWVLSRLDLLRDLYGKVIIPSAVRAEFLATERDARESALASAPWITIVPLTNPRHALRYAGLDEGEAEVLALAEELGGIVVMDERKGRRYASRLGLPLTGTLGLLLLAKERGLLASVGEAMDTLQAAGLRLHAGLISEVLRLAGEAD